VLPRIDPNTAANVHGPRGPERRLLIYRL
jgi:hypothetical protein